MFLARCAHSCCCQKNNLTIAHQLNNALNLERNGTSRKLPEFIALFYGNHIDFVVAGKSPDQFTEGFDLVRILIIMKLNSLRLRCNMGHCAVVQFGHNNNCLTTFDLDAAYFHFYLSDMVGAIFGRVAGNG